MSAPPRKWIERTDWYAMPRSHVHAYHGAVMCDGVLLLEGATHIVERVVRDHNAFDALLAVAVAAELNQNARLWGAPLSEALRQLEISHPDWRSWLPDGRHAPTQE